MSSKRPRENDDSNLLKPQKILKLAKIFDGTYFEIVEHDENKKSITAKCLNCLIKENNIRGSSTTTGNFYKHYLKVHPDKHDEMRIYCDEKAEHRKKVAEFKTKVQSVLPFSNVLDPKKVSFVLYTKTKRFV